jgi:hypothetical protein
MNIQQHISSIRPQLLHLLRMSQRSVDYATKAYELRSFELCKYVRESGPEFDSFLFYIQDHCRSVAVCSNTRSALSTLRICRALHSMQNEAIEIAGSILAFSEAGLTYESQPVREVGQVANRLVRLCTVALSKQEARHANEVLQSRRIGQWFELTAHCARQEVVSNSGPQFAFELALTKSFSQIAQQACEMADAIISQINVDRSTVFNNSRSRYALRGLSPTKGNKDSCLTTLSILESADGVSTI